MKFSVEERVIIETEEELIQKLNGIEGMEGFVRFSGSPIQKGDLFLNVDRVSLERDPDRGILLEGFFSNVENESIEFFFENGVWFWTRVKVEGLEGVKPLLYSSKVAQRKVKMLPVFEPQPVVGKYFKIGKNGGVEEVESRDETAFQVKKLKKVLFWGFSTEGERDGE
jgi:hypothetical protein